MLSSESLSDLKDWILILILIYQPTAINQKNNFDGLLVYFFKGTFSSLRQFLATDSPLKMTKNAFYLALQAFFVLKIIKF